MKATTVIRTCACVLALMLCQFADAADSPNRPSKTNTTANGHAKPSSFAPRHSANHVYGAPIQAPILKMRKPEPKDTKANTKPSG